MSDFSRRDFVHGLMGLAAGGTLLLPRGVQATPASGTLGAYGAFLEAEKQQEAAPPMGKKWAATEDNILGPYYRKGAPFRAKITPPLEAGTVLLIRGRVWGLDTRKPLAHAVLDIWQANAKGRYDNDDPKNPPAANLFLNRARLLTDETGYYEFETVHPGAYQTGPNEWRPAHIHYLVRHPRYKDLITQLYFTGDPHNKTDQFIKQSLIIDLEKKKVGGGTYESGTFNIVLAPA